MKAAGRRWTELVDAPPGLLATEVAPGILCVCDGIVARSERSLFYLIRGRDADCLIDGGWGFSSSLDAVRPDAGKPLIAIATHSHCDHIGLLHLAGRRYAHRAEAAVFAEPTPIATQALPYVDGLAALADGGSIDPATIDLVPCPIDEFIDDGSVIDLGDRRLTVLHTPGHSPGSLCIVDAQAGFLFCADTVHDGHIRNDIPGADRNDLLRSHERLAEVDFRQALPGHGAMLDRKAFIDRMMRYRREPTGTIIDA